MGDNDTTAGTGAGTGTDAGAASPLDALAELIAIVERLRDPVSGCPWDLEQTHESLIPYVLEEAHEVADAIRQGESDPLCEELGDLLLQVVLHARIAQEAGRFDLAAIARAINAKMVRRHPHVFGPDGAANPDQRPDRPADAAAVRVRWEAIKAAEKQAAAAANPAAANPAAAAAGGPGTPTSASPLSDQLAGKLRGQSALAGAMTISRRAAAAGFEWDDLAGVWAKVDEELDELRQALAQGDPAHAQSELGDVLFTLVNLARWSNLDPEAGLAGTNRRFLDRFSRVEAALGGELGGRPLAELETHWRQAKAQIRAEQGQDPNSQS
ncbi:MAG: nucleoside triphosphate pyrophosphohydrolase [Cyanobacteriota bacterium]